MAQSAVEWISPDEYLRREAVSETKNEYSDGRIYPWGEPPPALLGGARRRALLVTNVVGALHETLRDELWEVYASAIRLPHDFGFDVAVSREPEFEGDTLLNPIVLIQVLSSGEDGRQRSLVDYDALVQEVWFVFQDRRVIHHNRRLGATQWILRTHEEGSVFSEALGTALSVETIYRGVSLGLSLPLR